MSASKKLKFITHARLKDVIGRGLINDDNIAIIELIKNSKDAGSPDVSISFFEEAEKEGIEEEARTVLYIEDAGAGMSMDDIEYKWLNIAYSEKKNSRKVDGGAYAGNKGIGRFSCDRLGKVLNIYTRKKGGRFIALKIDWTNYEVNGRDVEIGHIEAVARYISPKEFKEETDVEPFSHGTLLVISDLRSDWDLDKLKSLRKELERFSIDPNKTFEVELHHWHYEDSHEINKPIQNKVFEDLDFRTSSIEASIDGNGDAIKISLRHDGDFVFTSTEKNPYDALSNIRVKVFFLNQPAKAFFNRRTGYRSVAFGSIFLFLNGFRVLPYGSEGDDWLGLDRRRQQGQRRFLGTREMVGYVEITDDNDEFIPVSSREGLVENSAFHQLSSSEKEIASSFDEAKLYGFLHKLTRKLEKFVVDGLDWDRISDTTLGDDALIAGDFEYLESEKPILETIDSIVRVRSPAAHIQDIEINLKYLSELAEQESEDYHLMVETLESKFDGTSIDKLKPSEKRDLSKFVSRQAKELAAKEATNKVLLKKSTKIKKELKNERKRRMYAESHLKPDSVRYREITHHVGLLSKEARKELRKALNIGNSELLIARGQDSIDKVQNLEKMIRKMQASFFHIDKIRKLSKIITRANFDMMSDSKWEDYSSGVEEYVTEIMKSGVSWGIDVSFKNRENISKMVNFSPLEQAMLIDNILDNAQDAKAKKVVITVHQDEKYYFIDFTDDGIGLDTSYSSEELFYAGITTTKGSGIGLSQIKQIAEGLNGEVSIFDNQVKGCTVRLRWVK